MRRILSLLILSLAPSGVYAQSIITNLSDANASIRVITKKLENLPKNSANTAVIYMQTKGLIEHLNELNKTIYGINGIDERKDFYDAEPGQQRAFSSVVALVDSNALTRSRDGTFDMPSNGAGLCSPDQIKVINKKTGSSYLLERFYNEPSDAFCSGVLLRPNIVLTAGHCIESAEKCTSTRYITGFYMKDATSKPQHHIGSDQVYTCKRLVDRVMDPATKSDWAILELDRSVPSAPAVEIGDVSKMEQDDGVAVVGFPMGLPAKFSGDGMVRTVEKAYFTSSVSTYGGNSGSPVYRSDSLRAGRLVLEGILDRGEDDFEVTDPCRISKRCSFPGYRGEDATLISEIMPHVPAP